MDDLEGIVSFNGRGFDLPLLETRFLLSRLRPDLLDAPHLDLLSPARRLWRARLASCALSSLEQNILEVHRDERDVPGFLIPHMYFRYLQTGDASRAETCSRTAVRLEPGLADGYISLCQVCIAGGRFVEAREFARQACASGPDQPLAWSLLGYANERLEDWADAETAYSHALQLDASSVNTLIGRARVRTALKQLDIVQQILCFKIVFDIKALAFPFFPLVLNFT